MNNSFGPRLTRLAHDILFGPVQIYTRRNIYFIFNILLVFFTLDIPKRYQIKRVWQIDPIVNKFDRCPFNFEKGSLPLFLWDDLQLKSGAAQTVLYRKNQQSLNVLLRVQFL